MTRLAGYLWDHGGPLEADLERFYARDLLDFWRGTLTWRKLGHLVANLPPGAALWQAVDVGDAWSVEAHLAANAGDTLAELLALVTGQTTFQKARRPGAPAPVAGAAQEPPATPIDIAERRALQFLELERQRQHEETG